MTVKQYGKAGGNQINVGRDLNINGNIPIDPETPSSSGNGSGGAAAGGGFGVLVVLAVVAYFLFSEGALQEPFPMTNDPWPKGATEGAILASAKDWITNCAREVVLQPKNCPQSANNQPDAKSIRWTLYGDPTEGAVPHFDEDASLFNVLGSTVMVARYQASGTTIFAVDPIHFWAKIKWQDGQVDVEKVSEFKGKPTIKISKQDPYIPWETLSAAVRVAFERCISATKAPMPAGCPTGTISNQDEVKWTLDSDPLLTARSSFDSRYGLIHVKGSYAATARHRDMFNKPKSESQSGNFDAVLAVVEEVPVVLTIDHDS